jgi:hypothetical protein
LLKFLSSSFENSKERTHCLRKNSSLIDLRQNARVNKNFPIDLLRSKIQKIDINKLSSELFERSFFSFFFSYLNFSSFFMNNRFFNTKKIKILAEIYRVFTSKHKNQSFMFENFVDSFYQEAKSSFTRFTFFKLITEVFDLFRSLKNTKNRSSTRRIVKNIESHDLMLKNFKKK